MHTLNQDFTLYYLKFESYYICHNIFKHLKVFRISHIYNFLFSFGEFFKIIKIVF